MDALEKGQNIAGKLSYGGDGRLIGTFKYGQESVDLEEEWEEACFGSHAKMSQAPGSY